MKTFTVKGQSDPFGLDPQILSHQHTNWLQQHNKNRFHLGLTDSHKQRFYKYEDFSMGIKNTNFLGNLDNQQLQKDSFFIKQNKKIAQIMRMQSTSNHAFEENQIKFLELVDKPYQTKSNSEWSVLNQSKLGIQLSFKLVKPIFSLIKQYQRVMPDSQLNNLS